MTQLKKVISLIIVSFCFVLVAAAQDGTTERRTAEERAKAITEKMKTELTLSDDQYEQVYEVNLKYAHKNEEIMTGSGGKLSKFKSLKSTNEKKTKELKGLLSKEQFEKYKKMQAELKQDAKQAFKDRNNG